MAKVLEQAILEVISILPTTPDTLQSELSLMTPRADETVPGVTEYLEGLGFKVQKIFEDAGLDLFCDDPDISEFRHMQKNLGVRMNQRENSLNKDGKRSYEWIDVYRNNIRGLIENPSNLNY